MLINGSAGLRGGMNIRTSHHLANAPLRFEKYEVQSAANRNGTHRYDYANEKGCAHVLCAVPACDSLRVRNFATLFVQGSTADRSQRSDHYISCAERDDRAENSLRLLFAVMTGCGDWAERPFQIVASGWRCRQNATSPRRPPRTRDTVDCGDSGLLHRHRLILSGFRCPPSSPIRRQAFVIRPSASSTG